MVKAKKEATYSPATLLGNSPTMLPRVILPPEALVWVSSNSRRSSLCFCLRVVHCPLYQRGQTAFPHLPSSKKCHHLHHQNMEPLTLHTPYQSPQSPRGTAYHPTMEGWENVFSILLPTMVKPIAFAFTIASNVLGLFKSFTYWKRSITPKQGMPLPRGRLSRTIYPPVAGSLNPGR